MSYPKHGMKRDSYRKLFCGPGGLHCQCCLDMSKHKAKTLESRHKRRRSRQELRSL
jgi:hypothetical protein